MTVGFFTYAHRKRLGSGSNNLRLRHVQTADLSKYIRQNCVCHVIAEAISTGRKGKRAE